MNIIVIGCGKVGSMLAGSLCRDGHDVVVVEKDEKAFSLLDNDFDGFTVVGVPIDHDTLRKAGIEGCDAVCAVSQDDNVNIMVCQMARTIFNVPIVLARTFDPRKQDVFRHFGLNTVCPTKLTVETVKAYLKDSESEQQQHFGTTTVSYRTVNVRQGLIGHRTSEVRCMEGEVLFAVQHSDHTTTLMQDKRVDLKEGDKLIFARVID